MKLGSGPPNAKIMLVGEAYGAEEERHGEPFVGASGQELNRMLHEVGISRTECYVTNLVNARPPNNDIAAWIALKKKDITPEHVPLRDKFVRPIVRLGYDSLIREIEMVKPNLIVAFGGTALWALTGASGILKWRGSMLTGEDLPGRPKVIPTIHPAAILRQWDMRAPAIMDLRRAAAERHSKEYLSKPHWKFTVRPNLEMVFGRLDELQTWAQDETREDELWLELDLETRAGHIACLGLSWSRTEALCIPFMCVERAEGYWSVEEEAAIVFRLYQLLTRPRVKVRWQNGLYDAQYIWKHWHFVPRGAQDTMISQHAIYAALPKSLAFLASMYSPHYVYWKDEGKTWGKDTGEEQLWGYNCQDCIRTREAGEAQLQVVKQLGLEPVHDFQQALFYPVLRAMQLGLRVRPERKNELADEVQEAISQREDFLRSVLGFSLNINSSPQMTALFYQDLAQPPIYTRATKHSAAHLTCDDEALQRIGQREPLLRPILTAISDIRTLGIFLKNFILAKVDEDGRMRCSYNIGGNAGGKSAPYSYRLSSSKSAFDSGTNLQTIPSDKSKSIGKAKARGSTFVLPNIRSMFGPDPGMTFFDMDLDRADLQVVVWEADDEMLKAALRLGADIHLLNVYSLDGQDPPPLDELVETHPKYPDHRGPRKHKREFSKVFCHACVTGDHEVLTPEGWQRIDTLEDWQDIATWSSSTQAITFERPYKWNRDFAVLGETLIHFNGQAYDQLVTADHRIPYTTVKTGFSVQQASKLPPSARLPKSGFYSSTGELDCARLVVAFLADGSIDDYGNVYFHFHKERKKERLRKLLAGREYSEYPDRFYVPRRSARDFTQFGKSYGPWLLNFQGSVLDEILEEVVYWDGSVGPTGAINFSAKDENTLQWLRTLAHLRGKASQYQGTTISSFGSEVHRCSLNNRPLARLQNMQVHKRIVTQDTPVFCPSTSTGFFLVRRNGKISVTGNSNYGGGARTIAIATGRSVAEVDRAQKLWFGAHPGIKRWQERVEQQVLRHRFVENRFGYRWYIFDRLDGILPEALAWIPQSTVACVINRAWEAIYRNLPEVQVLGQVHDSLFGQFPTAQRARLLPLIRQHSLITIPYDDPLIIPVGIGTSEVSWGDC